MNKITGEIFGLLALVVGVAILSVIVSRNSNTAQVLQAAGGSFSQILQAATAPVTGGSGRGFRNAGFGGSII